MNDKELKNAYEWIVGDDTGVSSKVIWATMMGVEAKNKSTPKDPSDFGRCYRLLKLIPSWESKLQYLKEVEYGYHSLNDNSDHFGLWSVFVDNYQEMCRLYESEHETGKCKKLYNFMRSKF